MVTCLDGQHAKMWRPAGERGEKGWAGTKVGCKIDLSFFPFILCQMSSSEDLRRSQLNMAAVEAELQSDLWRDFLICGFLSAHLFCAKSLNSEGFWFASYVQELSCRVNPRPGITGSFCAHPFSNLLLPNITESAWAQSRLVSIV